MSLSGMVYSHIRGRMLKTGQTTVYHVGDDGDYDAGLVKTYTVYTTDQYAGTTNLDVAHYAAATISFTAPNTIADAAAGLVTVLTGDTIVVKGSTSNDGVYTVAGGGVAASFTVNEAVVNEGAGAYITLYKRAALSNNCVWDRRTGLMWLRNTSSALKIGPTSNGLLNWYDVATTFTLHPAAADLQMVMPGNILKIVGGAGEVNRYHVGDIIDCAGFANAVNNLPGYCVLSVTVNGADLDIVLEPVNNTLIAEVAGGARSISIVCRSCFAYWATGNVEGIGGYSDWRLPSIFELYGLHDGTNGVPDVVAFPVWTAAADYTFSSTTRVDITNRFLGTFSGIPQASSATRTTPGICILVRGGV